MVNMVDMDTCKPMQCLMRGEIESIFRRFQSAAREWPRKLGFVHKPEERWQLGKRHSMVAREHRLEAYATLFCGLSSDL
jgi:hypothetical protein